MTHENEYHDNMITLLQLIWGEGYLATGGSGNVAKILIFDDGEFDIINREYQLMKGKLYPRMLELLGRESADHFVENWRAMAVKKGSGPFIY